MAGKAPTEELDVMLAGFEVAVVADVTKEKVMTLCSEEVDRVAGCDELVTAGAVDIEVIKETDIALGIEEGATAGTIDVPEAGVCIETTALDAGTCALEAGGGPLDIAEMALDTGPGMLAAGAGPLATAGAALGAEEATLGAGAAGAALGTEIVMLVAGGDAALGMERLELANAGATLVIEAAGTLTVRVLNAVVKSVTVQFVRRVIAVVCVV